MSCTEIFPSQQGEQLIVEASKRFQQSDTARGVKLVVAGLSRIRLSSISVWRKHVDDFRKGEAFRVVREGPLTSRAFRKPRGYPGDAETLDLLYGAVPLSKGISEVGKRIYFQNEFPGASGRSVRARRDLLTVKLDETGRRCSRARILAVACGHLREAQHSLAVNERQFSDFYALDHDEESLAVVEREQRADGITPIAGSVRSLLSGKTVFEDLDFVYAMGLYDYLEDNVATALTAKLFSMLRFGGQLLVANFAPNHHDIGYMEAAMDWWLIYRDEEHMRHLASGIQAPYELKAFRDIPGNLVFLELTKV